MRTVIRFYLDSRKRDLLPTTAPQIAEKLERVFSQLESAHGVRFGDEKIEGLSPIVLQTWFNAASAAWKPATANNYICVLNPFLRWAHAMDMTEKDLSAILHTSRLPSPDELPPDQQPKNKYYTHEEAHSLLNGTEGRNRLRDRAIMAVLLYGGFRVSEVCALTVGQVMDVPRGSVRLRRKGGAWKEQDISLDVYPYLEAYLATRKDISDRNAPLFLTSHGLPCTRQQIYKALRGKQEALGLATGPHALRHTAISEVANKLGAVAARDFANHKSVTTTNRYSHTTEQQRRDAADALRWN